VPSAACRESPLSSRREAAIEVAGVSLHERPFRTMLDLRGHPDDAAFALAVTETTGLALPAANRFSAGGECLLAWLGPDESFLVGDGRDAEAVVHRLRKRLAGIASALTDVSDGFTTLAISGDGARDFLARGWALDLHPRAFGPGHCAQSHLAKAPALLLQRDVAPGFEVIVRRSFADYLWSWLARP
jgi:sarcosine oxidase, subunit gamma